MKRKQNKKVSTIRQHWVGLLLVFTPVIIIVIAVGAVYLSNKESDSQRDHEDDIKFAKIETYIELVQNSLSLQIPNTDWTIEKTCSAPGVKWQILPYACTYYLIGTIDEGYVTQVESIVKSFSDDGKYRVYDNDETKFYDYQLSSVRGCGMKIYKDGNVWIGCNSDSRVARYSL